MPLYRLGDYRPKLPVGAFYFIAPGAQVIGKVALNADVGIWFHAVLRGDNEWLTIGARTNIQEGCCLHTDIGFPLIIGEDCTIGHHVILHGCTIGDNTLIGMGSTIMNGAKIGKNCLVGAGSLVMEGKEFPDNSLIVGSPAQVKRELSNDVVAKLTRSAAHYVENAKRFQAELVPLTDAP